MYIVIFETLMPSLIMAPLHGFENSLLKIVCGLRFYRLPVLFIFSRLISMGNTHPPPPYAHTSRIFSSEDRLSLFEWGSSRAKGREDGEQ